MEKRITFGVLAHVDSGKTTLSEAILFNAGTTRRLGRVDHKDSYLDTNSIERDRGITIFSKQAVFNIEDTVFTLLDTPGHTDFGLEAERTLAVLDYAVLIISAPEGIQSHTRTLWRLLESYNVPTFIFINKSDLPSPKRENIISEIKSKLSDRCIDFSKDFDDETSEMLAMCSEMLMDEYLNGDFSLDSISTAIEKREVFPCYFGSALKNDGVTEFMSALNKFTRQKSTKNAFGAKVFKVSFDEKGTRLSHLKITGGSLKVKTTINCGDIEEKINEIRIYSSNKYTLPPEAPSRSICTVTGLENSYPGMGLGFEKDLDKLILEPVFSYTVTLPDNISDADGFAAFKKLSEEETKLNVSWDKHNRRISLRLMGEVQTEILQRVIKERFGFDVTFDQGGIIYKETISDKVEGVGHYEPLRHYAEVHLILEPGKRGSGITFGSKCREDELDLNWQRLILTHLAEKTHLGVLTGSPITDINITLASARAHLKHTDGGDFRQATYRAVRHGLANAKSILLEPWYDIRIEVPKENIGRIISDLSQMGGSFSAPETDGEMSYIKASAPVAKIQSYQKEIISFTSGRGSMSLTFKGYEPCSNQEEIIEQIGYDFDSDVENSADSVFCSHGASVNVKWYDVYDNMHLESVLKKKTDEIQDTPKNEKKKFNALSVSDSELDRIFEMTFGKPKETKEVVKNRTGSNAIYKSKNKPAVLKDEYILVDGYNIIFDWDDLRKLAEDDIDLARNTLINRLINYRAVKGCNLAVVFDAYKVKGGLGEVEKTGGISVVYTKEAETADSYIEKASHTLASNYLVRVATSDRMEQMIILGSGALRMSSPAFQKEVTAVENSIREFLNNQHL